MKPDESKEPTDRAERALEGESGAIGGRSPAGDGPDLEGIILAGGRSRRMGGMTKALLPVGEVEMIRRVADRMRAACVRVSVSVASEETAAPYRGLGLPLLVDAHADLGPIAGLHAAFAGAKADLVWASACDMPFVSSAAGAWMADRLERSGAMAVVPLVGGRLHPLQAAYRAECREETARSVEEGRRRLTDLLDRIETLAVPEEEFVRAGVNPDFVLNVNTPEDYREALYLEERRRGV